ncbi:MAG: alpha/beta fold hydrolase [Alphaproteobacteria bacterium]
MPDKVISNGPENADRVFVFAHGAGAPMDSGFMETVATGLARHGIRVLRFEFPYMQRRRSEGTRRPPDKQPVLLQHFTETLFSLIRPDKSRLFVGGKSMGGRMATLLTADAAVVSQAGICGCICFGYPFHAPGKPMGNRMDHFQSLEMPLLICQGTRDPFGGREEFGTANLPRPVAIEWLEDGDHDLKPRKKSGLSHAENIERAINLSVQFMKN